MTATGSGVILFTRRMSQPVPVCSSGSLHIHHFEVLPADRFGVLQASTVARCSKCLYPALPQTAQRAFGNHPDGRHGNPYKYLEVD